MLQADARASTIRGKRKVHRVIFAIIIVFCLRAAWTTYTPPAPRVVVTQLPVASRDTPTPTALVDIQDTLNIVAAYMRRGVDVNKDGVTNCVDASIVFYRYYPRKNEVIITTNRNAATDFYHAFVVVLVNGVWRGVEPQAVFAGHSSYWMFDVWDERYDYTLNRTATRQYLPYVESSLW